MQAPAPPGCYPSSTTTAPRRSINDSSFNEHLADASRLIEDKNPGRAVGFLVKALERGVLTFEGDPSDRVRRLSHKIVEFVEMAVHEAGRTELTQWIAASGAGLMRQLVDFAVGQGEPEICTEVLQLVTRIIALLPEGGDLESVKLRCDSLLEGYRLARLNGHPQEVDFLFQLGTSYLQYARRLSFEACFEKGYKKASSCFNEVIRLGHRTDEASRLLAEIEESYRQRASEGMGDWAEHQVYPNPSPAKAQALAHFAEQMIKFGEIDIACRCFAQASRADDAYDERHSEASKMAPRQGWRIRRQILAGLRQLVIASEDHPSSKPVPEVFHASVERSYEAAGIAVDIDPGQLTTQQCQELLSNLIKEFTALLYSQAIAGIGNPPCNYALFGLGSLARGEICLYSDFDGGVLVETDNARVRDYFRRVGHYLELLVMNLGETHVLLFPEDQKTVDGFNMDPAGLHPARLVSIPGELAAHQEAELGWLRADHDLDPTRNAYRLACFIVGERGLYDEYAAALNRFFTVEGNAETYGSYLARRWKPCERGETFNAKGDLYRPLTLLIDALAVRHRCEGVKTIERLESLAPHLPPFLHRLVRRGLELACRLRLAAQSHYGRESEDVRLLPTMEEKGVYLVLGRDRNLLQELEELLFKPLSEIALGEGLDRAPLERVRIAYAERLLDAGSPLAAQTVIEGLEERAPALRAPIELYLGHFGEACDLYESQHPTGDALLESYNPYREALHNFDSLPETDGLAPLAGRLVFLRIRGSRPVIPSPTQALFEGPSNTRRAALISYLLKLRDQEHLSTPIDRYLSTIVSPQSPLPNCEADLFSGLLPTPCSTCEEFLYHDLIALLESLIGQEPKPAAYSYLFRLFPSVVRHEFLRRLEAFRVNPKVMHRLRQLPEPDGSRPFVLTPAPSVSLRERIAGKGSRGRVTEMGGLSYKIAKGSIEIFRRLLRGERGRFGRHAVLTCEGYHLKAWPEFSGRAAAYISLCRLMTGEALPNLSLLKVEVDGETFPITASETVAGHNLQDLLEIHPQIERLDPYYYSWSVVMAMITLPEDQKPDNFILRRCQYSERLRLVDVDPERVFFSATTPRFLRSDQLQCKSILFCLDQMRQPIDPNVREELLALHPAAFFDRWLTEMETYNEHSLELFGNAHIDKCLRRDPVSVLPFFLKPSTRDPKTEVIRENGLLLNLYTRLRKLQAALGASPDAPLLKLLAAVDPHLANVYGAQLDQDKPAIRRFCNATEGLYERRKGSTLSITSSRLSGAHRSLNAFRDAGWTTRSARRDLARICLAHTSIEEIRNDLLNGEGITLKTLNLPEVSNVVLKGVDFSSLPPPEHPKIIARIIGLCFTRLHLSHCHGLTDRLLRQILQSCPDLTLLDLGHASGPHTLDCLHLVPELQYLRLSHVSTMQRLCNTNWPSKVSTLNLPHLIRLDISHCENLMVVNLRADQLKHLAARGPLPSTKWSLVHPQLVSLAVDSEALVRRFTSTRSPPKHINFNGLSIRPIEEIESLPLLPDLRSTWVRCGKRGRIMEHRSGEYNFSKADSIARELYPQYRINHHGPQGVLMKNT